MVHKWIILIMAFLILIPNVSAYDFLGVFQNDTTVNHTTISPSFFWTENCDVNVSLFMTTTDAGSFTHNWYSPDNTLLAFSTQTFGGGITCRFQGNPTASTSLNDYYESQTTTLTSVTANTWVRTLYSCEPDENELVTYSNTDIVDSFGFYPYEYVRRTGGYCEIGSPGTLPTTTAQLVLVIDYLNNGYFTDCGSDLIKGSVNADPITCALNRFFGHTWWSVRPFNSGVFGQVNISVTDMTHIETDIAFSSLTCTTDKIFLWRVVNNQTTLLSASVPYSDSLFLEAEEDYWLFIGSVCTGFTGGSGTSTLGYNASIYEIIINAFEPDFLCGEFGECINGTQIRICVDQRGVAPNRIEQASCFDVPAHEIDIGFEVVKDLVPQFIFICQKDWRVTGCFNFLETITAAFPVNWTISADADIVLTDTFRQNYIRISDDTSTVGTKSLQMNYIPPKPSEPVNNGTGGTECGNKTIGDFPFVTTGLNQSLFVSINISFPSPFIQLRLDSRKCSEQLLQYDYTGDFLGINCGKRCYAPNCTGEPRGKYRVGVFDAQTLEQIVEFRDTALNSWTSHIIDLSNAGLLVNHNYTIIIVVNPQIETGVFDPDAHCVYFDNFRVTVTEVALPECVTICEGFNLLLATQNGDICFFTEITNSPECAPDTDTATSFQNFEEVCIGTTLHFFNNETGLWDTVEDNDLCISQISDVANESLITEPLESPQAWIDWILFLISPIFIYFYISLAISGAVGALVKAWEAFGITFATCLFIGMLITVPGGTASIIPIWVGVAMIAVISLMIASKLRGISIGGPGG